MPAPKDAPAPDPMADVLARLAALEDFIATLPPQLATYGMGHYQGPARAEAADHFNSKRDAIKGRADERAKQRDIDNPKPQPRPKPGDPS